MATVLVIETHEPLMRLMSWFLLEAEHRVKAAASFEEARERAATSPQIIVFNTHMEIEDKRAAIGELRGISPASRILDIRDAEAPEADTGADGYLTIPFDSFDLLAAVSRLS
jgi:DNA-binding response OmpR family regulator